MSYKFYSIETKIAALEEYDAGHSNKGITKKYKLGKYTLNFWLKDHKKKLKSKTKAKVVPVILGIKEKLTNLFKEREEKIKVLQTEQHFINNLYNELELQK